MNIRMKETAAVSCYLEVTLCAGVYQHGAYKLFVSRRNTTEQIININYFV